jgi:hypothetical protein
MKSILVTKHNTKVECWGKNLTVIREIIRTRNCSSTLSVFTKKKLKKKKSYQIQILDTRHKL